MATLWDEYQKNKPSGNKQTPAKQQSIEPSTWDEYVFQQKNPQGYDTYKKLIRQTTKARLQEENRVYTYNNYADLYNSYLDQINAFASGATETLGPGAGGFYQKPEAYADIAERATQLQDTGRDMNTKWNLARNTPMPAGAHELPSPVDLNRQMADISGIASKQSQYYGQYKTPQEYYNRMMVPEVTPRELQGPVNPDWQQDYLKPDAKLPEDTRSTARNAMSGSDVRYVDYAKPAYTDDELLKLVSRGEEYAQYTAGVPGNALPASRVPGNVAQFFGKKYADPMLERESQYARWEREQTPETIRFLEHSGRLQTMPMQQRTTTLKLAYQQEADKLGEQMRGMDVPSPEGRRAEIDYQLQYGALESDEQLKLQAERALLVSGDDAWREWFAGNDEYKDLKFKKANAEYYARRYETIEGWQKVDRKYKYLWNSSDFAEISAFDPEKAAINKSDSSVTKKARQFYKYLNAGLERKRELEQTSSTVTSGGIVTVTPDVLNMGLNTLDAEEILIFNYLFTKNSPEAAMQYIDDKKSELLARRALLRQQNLEEMTEDAVEAMSALTLMWQLENAVLGPAQFIAGALGADPNDIIFDKQSDVNTVRTKSGQVLDDVYGNAMIPILNVPVASFVYNAGMSALDSLVGRALGGLTRYRGMNRLLMTSRVLGSQMQQSLKDGDEQGVAIFRGLAAAVVENVTEAMGDKAFFGTPKNVALYLAQNFFSEGSEELLANLGNTLVDMAARGTQSDIYQNALRAAGAGGLSRETAESYAFREWMKEAGTDFLSGALMGIMAGAPGAPGHYQRTYDSTVNNAYDSIMQQEGVTYSPQDRLNLNMGELLQGDTPTTIESVLAPTNTRTEGYERAEKADKTASDLLAETKARLNAARQGEVSSQLAQWAALDQENAQAEARKPASPDPDPYEAAKQGEVSSRQQLPSQSDIQTQQARQSWLDQAVADKEAAIRRRDEAVRRLNQTRQNIAGMQLANAAKLDAQIMQDMKSRLADLQAIPDDQMGGAEVGQELDKLENQMRQFLPAQEQLDSEQATLDARQTALEKPGPDPYEAAKRREQQAQLDQEQAEIDRRRAELESPGPDPYEAEKQREQQAQLDSEDAALDARKPTKLGPPATETIDAFQAELDAVDINAPDAMEKIAEIQKRMDMAGIKRAEEAQIPYHGRDISYKRENIPDIQEHRAKNPELNDEAFDFAAEAAYGAGLSGSKTLFEVSAAIKDLAPETAKALFDAGLGVYNAKAGERHALRQRMKDYMPKPGQGKLIIPKEVIQKMNPEQKKLAADLQKFIIMAGVEGELFASETADESGRILSEEGSFDPSTGRFRFDINAGINFVAELKNKARGAVEFALPRVMGHEFTHYLKTTAPELYAVYQDAIFTELAKKESVDDLVMQELGRARKGALTYDVALEEVVARSSEMMLRDTQFMQNVMGEKPNLWEKFKAWVADFIKGIQERMKGMNPAYAGAKSLIETGNGIVKYAGNLQTLWDKAMAQSIIDRVSPDSGAVTPLKTASAVQVTKPSSVVTTPLKSSAGGNTGVSYTADNTPINFRYRAVNINDLNTSHDDNFNINPAFPEELQPRDRERSGLKDQVNEIARLLNPARLGESAEVTGGAPVIGSDMNVEVGNGRIMALRAARARYKNNAKAYTAWLRENAASFGIDPATITNDSVLVRERVDEPGFDRATYTQKANVPTTATSSETENASVDAGKITNDMLVAAELRGGELNMSGASRFVTKFVNKIIPLNERNSYVDKDGNLSQRGETRIRNALFQAAYGDEQMTSQLAEVTEGEVRNVIKAMTNIAPRLTMMNADVASGRLHPVVPTMEIVQAYQAYRNLKQTGGDVVAYIAQLPMIEMDKDAAKALVAMFEANKNAPNRMTDNLNAILDAAVAMGNPDQMVMPGMEGLDATKLSVVNDGIARAGGEQMKFSERPLAPPLYSKMAQEIEAFKGDKMGAGSLINYLRGKGVKADEIRWSGIQTFLQGKKSVTKDELLEFARGNELRVEDVSRSSDGAIEARIQELAEAKYRILGDEASGYVTLVVPGDGNPEPYLQFDYNDEDGFWVDADGEQDPVETFDEAYTILSDKQNELINEYLEDNDWKEPEPITRYNQYTLPGGDNYREVLFTAPDLDGTFQSAHWDEKNVLAHARLQDFSTADGKPVLFVEEVQSDWHEQGRERGYKDASVIETRSYADITSDIQDAAAVLLEVKRGIATAHNEPYFRISENEMTDAERSARDAAEEKLHELQQERAAASANNMLIPQAPFATNWHEYVLKRVLRMAAEGDYDYVAWTTGEMQADRYDLAKQIGSVRVSEMGNQDGVFWVAVSDPGGNYLAGFPNDHMTKAEIVEMFGKDLGTRMINGAVDAEGEEFEISGNGLSIGGTGMKAFYDIGGKSSQNIPRFLNKYAGQWGAKVQTIKMDKHTVPAVEVTEKMRESVLYEGQPLYAERDHDNSLPSARAILAGAFGQVAQTTAEKENVEKYRKNADRYNRLENELNNLLEKRKQLYRDKAPQTEKNELRADINALRDKLDKADRVLLNLQMSKPLRDVVAREVDKAYQSQNAKSQERQKEYRERVRLRSKEQLAQWKDKYKQKESDRKRITQAKDSIHKLSSDLREAVVTPTAKKHVPESMRGVIGEFLTILNEQSRRSLGGGMDTRADRAFYDKMDALVKAINNIRRMQYQASMDEGGGNEGITGHLDIPDDIALEMEQLVQQVKDIIDAGEGEYVINRMNLEQLESLDKMLRVINSAVRKANALHNVPGYQQTSDLAGATHTFLGKMKSKLHRIRKTDRFLNWSNTEPIYALDRLGPAGKAIAAALIKGMDTQAKNSKRVLDFALETFSEKESREWGKTLHHFTLDGQPVVMNTAQLMSLYLLNKRDQARGHLYGGGFRVETFKVNGKNYADGGHVLLERDVAMMLKELAPDQKKKADALQEFLSTVGAEWGNTVSMARWGFNYFNEENYFPIESARENIEERLESAEGNPLYRLLNLGHTKGLIKGANNQIMLRNVVDVFAAHMTDMAQYNALAMPLLDAIKWYNYQESKKDHETGRKWVTSVRKDMMWAFGDAAPAYMYRLLSDISGARMTGFSGAETYGLTALRRYNRAMVAANLRVAVLQPTAFLRAHNVINARHLTLGALKNVVQLRKNIREMEKWSGIAIWKQMGFYDINLSRSLLEMIKRDNPLIDRMTEASMKLPQAMDRLTWAAIWGGAKNQVAANNPGLDRNSDAFYKKVQELFDDAIYRTQVVDSMLTRSEHMRETNLVSKWTSSFMSEPTKTYNILAGQVHAFTDDIAGGMTRGQAWAKNRAKIGRTMMTYGITVALTSAVEAMMGAWRDDDDYKTFWEKFLAELKSNALDNLTPLNWLPIVNDVWQLAKDFLGRSFGVDLWGYEEKSILTAGIQMLFDGTSRIISYIKKPEGKYFYGATYELLRGISAISGHPLAAATREVVDLWNNTAGLIYPEYQIKRFPPAVGDGYDKIYEAMVAGDKEAEKRYRDTVIQNYKGSGDIEKNIGQGLGERIKADYLGGTIGLEEMLTRKAEWAGYTDAQEDIRDAFKAGTIDRKEAERLLKEYAGDKEPKEMFKLLERWETEDEAPDKDGDGTPDFSILDKFYTAVRTGKNLRAVVTEYTDPNKYAYDSKYLAGQINTAFKQEYIDNPAQRSKLKGYLLNAYSLLGYDREERSGEIDRWLMKYDSADFENAIATGVNLKAVIDEKIKYSTAKNPKGVIISQVTATFADQYKKMSPGERARIKPRLIDAYVMLGYDRAYSSKKIDKWLTD